MERAFVDTSAWVAHLNRKDSAHEAVGRALRSRAGRLVTSSYVLDEALTLARFRLGHRAAVALGDLLRDPDAVDLIRITPADEAEAWDLFVARDDQRYSFTDCTSFALMRRMGLETTVTLDADFRGEGFLVEPS